MTGFFIFVKKDMNRLIYILGLITIMGCTENTYITEEIEDVEVIDPFKNCYRVVSVKSNVAECGNILGIEVVTNEVFMSGKQPTRAQKTLICVTNTLYKFNDFNLSQLICDLSIYD